MIEIRHPFGAGLRFLFLVMIQVSIAEILDRKYKSNYLALRRLDRTRQEVSFQFLLVYSLLVYSILL